VKLAVSVLGVPHYRRPTCESVGIARTCSNVFRSREIDRPSIEYLLTKYISFRAKGSIYSVFALARRALRCGPNATSSAKPRLAGSVLYDVASHPCRLLANETRGRINYFKVVLGVIDNSGMLEGAVLKVISNPIFKTMDRFVFVRRLSLKSTAAFMVSNSSGRRGVLGC
jgi:hypothetical protein